MCPQCLHAWVHVHMLCPFCYQLLQLTVCCFVHNGKWNEIVIISLYFSIPCCVNDKMEPCSDTNSLMWCIMHVQCIYGIRYILSWIDADKSIKKCLCLHLKHLNRCICNLRPCQKALLTTNSLFQRLCI